MFQPEVTIYGFEGNKMGLPQYNRMNDFAHNSLAEFDDSEVAEVEFGPKTSSTENFEHLVVYGTEGMEIVAVESEDLIVYEPEVDEEGCGSEIGSTENFEDLGMYETDGEKVSGVAAEDWVAFDPDVQEEEFVCGIASTENCEDSVMCEPDGLSKGQSYPKSDYGFRGIRLCQ